MSDSKEFCFIFCYLESPYFCLHLWKMFSLEIEILVDNFLNMSLYCFPVSTISEEILAIILTVIPYTWCFSLAAFKIYCLSLGFQCLTMMCLDVVLFVFTLLGICWAYWIYSLIFFIKCEKFLALVHLFSLILGLPLHKLAFFGIAAASK